MSAVNRNNCRCLLIVCSLFECSFHSMERAIFTDRNIKYAIIVSSDEIAENTESKHVCPIVDNENVIPRKCEHNIIADKSIPWNSQGQQTTFVDSNHEFLRDSNVCSTDKWNETFYTR